MSNTCIKYFLTQSDHRRFGACLAHERSLGASLGLAYTVGGRSLFVSPTNGRRGHAVARVRRPEKSRDWVTQLLLKKFGVEQSPSMPGRVVIVALRTIQSSRLALISFPNLPNTNLSGQNLMVRLSSKHDDSRMVHVWE